MKSKSKELTNIKGFTLIEILLVLVIVGILILASTRYLQERATQMRIDRTSIQMQQILNAGLAFYVANGSWPPGPTLACLQGTACPSPYNTPPLPVYLPTPLTSPWGGAAYTIASNAKLFFVHTNINAGTGATQSAAAIARVIAGTLPLSYTTTSFALPPTANPACGAGANCTVVGSVNIPGQSLNNARSVNFAGLYKHGGCVPVPQCPVDSTGTTMTAQIMVVPVSVSGVNDTGSTTNVYPISSFTAYATGTPTGGTNPPRCVGDTLGPTSPCTANVSGGTSANYWRACLQIVTEKGEVATTNAGRWGNAVTLMAITRCAVTAEPAGSTFNVYSR